MDFQKLVDVYEQLEKTASGNTMREILADFFKAVPTSDIAIVSYLTLGRIASEYEDVVLGLAEKSVLKAIAAAAGVDISKVTIVMNEIGDAGLTAEKFLQKKPRTLVPVGTLTIHELFDKLHTLAAATGTGSQEKKIAILVSLLQKTSARGAKYIARIVLGMLRMGVGSMTVLDALAIAYTAEKSNKKTLEAAYNICPDVGIIAETLAEHGLAGVNKIDIHVGRPIQMMLAQRINSLEEISDKIPGEVTVEAKYDGERIQAHKDKTGKITLFSRRLENITPQFPDLVKALRKDINAKEFVAEGEVLALGKEEKPLPFQVLMKRRRKYDVEEFVQKIPTQIKLFDLLYLNGNSLLHQPYYKRSDQLAKIVQITKQVALTEKIITADVEEMSGFFQTMLQKGFEGIIIKSRAENSGYQAGTRGWNWIKWKKEYVAELADTFDLVIVGAFHGRGKRSGAYGALLCAVYNEPQDQFETICKLGTGLTDETLEGLPKRLSLYKLDKKPVRLTIKKEMEPDIWFEPRIVVEVLAAEITKSPFHTCASGLALRFPRFIKYRDDKTAEQATTSKEIEKMYKKK